MATMSYSEILYDKDGPILYLTLNRPEKLNAFTGTMQKELIDAYERADEDDDVRAIIVTGAGRGFCAGADLSGGGDTFAGRRQDIDPDDYRDGGGVLTLALYKIGKPVIAAINGPAVGIGATMTLPMDIRLASTEARIGFVFSRRGIVPEACSSYFLPRIVGPGQAAEWFYTGRVFDAQEALDGGLVSRVLEPDKLLDACAEIALEIADNTAPVSVSLCRQMIYSGLSATHPMESHRIESKGIYWMGKSPDVREGVEAFLEKRPAKYPQRPSKDMPPYYPWREEPDFR